MLSITALSLLSLSVLSTSALAQNRIGSGKAHEWYQEHCAVCHGKDLEGGIGSNLIDGDWLRGGTDADLTRVILKGVPDMGMQAYEGVLTPEQIRSLVIYLRERRELAEETAREAALEPVGETFTSQHHRFRLQPVVSIEDDIFWSVSFLPDGTMMLTEFKGQLRFFRNGELEPPVKGLPDIWHRGQGGLLEAQAHPDYQQNGWIYLGYAHSDDGKSGTTRIVRGRIRNNAWVDQETIFEVDAVERFTSGVHFGTRFVFDDGYLYFSIGDRGRQNDAQNLELPSGKIHRIHDDGRVPKDNPFLKDASAYPTIWTYGNRNPQGLDQHPATGVIWETEHGPRGGDELNVVRRGINYGWPVITYGMNYNGTPVTDKTEAPGMEQPIHHWTPSIAVCGIDFYEGQAFPKWHHDLFITGLASQHLERVKLSGQTIVEHEIVLVNQGRVRDVSTGPDGLLYVILNKERRGKGSVYRLVPQP